MPAGLKLVDFRQISRISNKSILVLLSKQPKNAVLMSRAAESVHQTVGPPQPQPPQPQQQQQQRIFGSVSVLLRILTEEPGKAVLMSQRTL